MMVNRVSKMNIVTIRARSENHIIIKLRTEQYITYHSNTG